jgi:uncharacterized protein (TIGR03435 family)
MEASSRYVALTYSGSYCRFTSAMRAATVVDVSRTVRFSLTLTRPTVGMLWLASIYALRCFAQAPAFDMASVKLAGGATFEGPPMQTTHGTLTVHGLSLRACLQWAYQLQAVQVNGPDWLDNVKLDIAASARAQDDDPRLFLMLRTLLGERLGVSAHLERKEMPVYAVVIGKHGLKMTASNIDGPQMITLDQNGIETHLRWSMYELMAEFSAVLGRPLVNETGLNGRYDFHIDPKKVPPDYRGADRAAIQLVGVMKTQLGLDIKSRKQAVDVLVVDHAEREPREN